MNRIVSINLSRFFKKRSLVFGKSQNYTILKETPVERTVKNREFSFINLDANTSVLKDTILFKYENPKLFRAINLFAIAQFFFWNWLSYFSLTNLKDIPVAEESKEKLPFWRRVNLGENKYRNGIAAMCFIIGYGILTASWMFTLKSVSCFFLLKYLFYKNDFLQVRLLILRQGGNTVTFVNYTPFGKNRIMDVPLKYISAEESRQMAKVTMPLKVKGHKLFYVLDMRGEFKNTKLFDQTIGLQRNFSKR